VNKEELLRVLSQGERRALYILNIIFEIRARKKADQKTLLIIDDVADSFDYKNKYAIVEYLKEISEDENFFQIILTHNFDFLKLLLNWLNKIPKAKKQTSHYMLLCNIQADGTRTAVIKPLDKELRQNESEYSWLFKQLYNFRSDGSIAGSYHIPNMARKVLEAFLDFYYPGSETLYKKLERVEFDAIKRTALLKFANDLSHSTGKGFDPALVPETQKNVTYLLKMIETVSPIHFKSLKDSIEAD
jgi:wobble nucleotide-excising tRNase